MAKRKHKSRVLTVRSGDSPTPERRAQNGGVAKEVTDRDCRGNALMYRFKAVADCPLDAYFQRGHLTETEYKASMKFRHAYLRAILRVKVQDIDSGSRGDPEMAALMPIHSERILNEAYAVLSSAQKALIISVCGHDEWAGGFYKLQTLHRGLEKLADLWKLS